MAINIMRKYKHSAEYHARACELTRIWRLKNPERYAEINARSADYLRQRLGDSGKVVVNANAMKLDLGLTDDYYPDFAEYAKRPGRDFVFDMTTEQTATEPWEYIIAQKCADNE